MKDLFKFAIALLILVVMVREGCNCEGSDVSISGKTGKTEMSGTYYGDSSISVAGYNVASRIYSISQKHTDLNKIIVIYTIDWKNGYGEKVEKEITIVAENLDEIRRYKSKQAIEGSYLADTYSSLILLESGLFR